MREAGETILGDGISVEILSPVIVCDDKVFEISLGNGSEHAGQKIAIGESISIYTHGRHVLQLTNMALRRRVLRALVLRELQVYRRLVLPDFQARTGFRVPDYEYEELLNGYTRHSAAVVEWITDKNGVGVAKSWRIADPDAAKRAAARQGYRTFRPEAIEAIKARASKQAASE